MNLYFQHYNGDLSLVATNVDPEYATELIRADVAARNPNYRIYYIRYWEHDGGIKYDVGSHSEFYILKGE